jgi:ribonucleoside-diphosphate reductase alpha chain|tara:strand:- start:238 stop:2532 length:2295 start_codon:yes stop_codon:yes gene_type:complete
MNDIQVTKRTGDKEPLDLEKLHKVVFYACEGVTGVSASEVEIKSSLQFYNGIKTSDIQETIIKSTADLISEETPGYQYVAGRLINYHIRKIVYEEFEPWHIYKLVERNVEAGFYDEALIKDYTKKEWNELNDYIKHDRDETLTYAGMEQWRGKYLVKNRVTNEIFETPQMAYMCIAATLFGDYPKEDRLRWVKDYYDAISTYVISLPTPVMAGVRTPQRQFSSCVLIETDDSLDSINATASSIVKYVSQKAGIGIGAGNIRAIGSPIRKGDAYHTGVVPFYKLFQSATRSCSQGGVRNGAATLYYPIWHLEAEDLLVLKNNKGTEDNRVRHMDYGVQFNKLMYERLLQGGDITLFSPSDVPGLYEAFFTDQDKFKELYETAERNTRLRKKTLKASELFSMFMEERKNTGRIYLMNVDHANDHSSFKPDVAPIRQSNLCCEIDLPTKPLKDFNDPDGEIALCTLSAINWGLIRDPKEFEKPCALAVRGLDALLSYQNYPVLAAENATMKRRPLGIGIINLAYFLARNDTNYTNPNLELVDEYAEAWSYYLIKASADLAVEKGACPGVDETKYGDGITPNQTYKLDVDELVKHKERMDWKGLRKQLADTGIRNSTLMALMPAETSAQISNSTNGIEPPRSYVSIKQSKDGVLKQVVPGFPRLKNKYELLWSQESPEGYIKIMSVLQKYIDQGISVNTSYNPQHYEDEKIPMSVMLQHLIMSYKYGLKQLYYFNTYDGAGDDISEREQIVLALPESVEEEDCEVCTI